MDPIETIVTAARKQEIVNITYTKKNGETKSYLVAPYSQRGNSLCMSDINEGSRSIKKFLIEGIMSAEATGQTFEPEWPVEL